LLDELQNLLDTDAQYREHIQKLETELSAFKRAYSNVDNERQQLQVLKEETDKQMNLLEDQLKVGIFHP
jgi:prefoldin subunit 5